MSDHRPPKDENKKASPAYPRIVRLFFKQTAAALLLGLLAFLMSSLPVPYLNNCADALGRALRYEMKLPAEKLPQWVRERIPEL